ncbi:MAG: PTS sugar transporter subunit IIA [Lachnospiraceae bacterium]|nr:PTS sugar transporter subunit IIA [Lachnospiraceae bacterium]
MATELINNDIVLFDVEATTKEEVIRLIADAMDQDGRLIDKEGYIQDVLKRESTSSTAIGFSTATPHAKSVSVKEPSLSFVRLKRPMQWDDEEVTMVFQIAVPSPGQGDRHLEILAKLFRNLVYDEFRDKLSAAKSQQEVVDLLKEF